MKPYWLTNGPLRAEFDDDDAGGGSIFDESDDVDLDEDEDEDDVDIDEDDDDDLESQKSPKFDMSQLPSAIGAAIAANLPRQPQQQQQTQMSQEERDKLLKKPNLDAKTVSAIWDAETPEERASALAGVLNQYVEHALLASGYMTHHQLQQLQSKLSPLEQAHQERQAEVFRTSIVDSYPALKGKQRAVDIAIQQVYQAASSGQVAFRTKQEAVKMVATVAKQMIQQIDPNFSLKRRTQKQFIPRGGGGGVPRQQQGGRKEKWAGQSIFQ
jgi:hypothetical protein